MWQRKFVLRVCERASVMRAFKLNLVEKQKKTNSIRKKSSSNTTVYNSHHIHTLAWIGWCITVVCGSNDWVNENKKKRTLGEKANKQQNNLIKEQQDRKKNGFYDSDRTLFIRTSHAHFIHAIRQRTQTINSDTASHRIHLVWCSTRFAVNVSEHPHFPFTYDLNARRVTMRLMRRRGHIFFSFPPFHTLVLCLQTNKAGWITPEIHTRKHIH